MRSQGGTQGTLWADHMGPALRWQARARFPRGKLHQTSTTPKSGAKATVLSKALHGWAGPAAGPPFCRGRALAGYPPASYSDDDFNRIGDRIIGEASTRGARRLGGRHASQGMRAQDFNGSASSWAHRWGLWPSHGPSPAPPRGNACTVSSNQPGAKVAWPGPYSDCPSRVQNGPAGASQRSPPPPRRQGAAAWVGPVFAGVWSEAAPVRTGACGSGANDSTRGVAEGPGPATCEQPAGAYRTTADWDSGNTTGHKYARQSWSGLGRERGLGAEGCCPSLWGCPPPRPGSRSRRRAHQPPPAAASSTRWPPSWPRRRPPTVGARAHRHRRRCRGIPRRRRCRRPAPCPRAPA